MTRIANLARNNLIDATTIATLHTAAEHALHDSQGGYPASTPGAGPATNHTPTYTGPCPEHECNQPRPCPEHDTHINLTIPERGANNKPDPATHDLQQLIKELETAAAANTRAARIMVRWGLPNINTDTVTKRLAAIDEGIWCRNCTRHGQHNPRRAEHTECNFCADYRNDYGLPASKAIWAARDARGGRIYVQDIERILDRDNKGWRKRRPKTKPAQPKATVGPEVAA